MQKSPAASFMASPCANQNYPNFHGQKRPRRLPRSALFAKVGIRRAGMKRKGQAEASVCRLIRITPLQGAMW
jgi:hypothetical protein